MAEATSNSGEMSFSTYDKTLQPMGVIADPVSVDGSTLLHKPGSFAFRIASNDDAVEDIMHKGSRVAIDYLGERIFSGMRRPVNGGLTAGEDVTFTVQGDRRVLDNTLAFIAPQHVVVPTSLDANTDDGLAQSWLPPGTAAGAAGTTVGQYGYVLWPDEVDSAESAIKWLITTNLIERLNRPVRVARNLNRGGDARSAGMLPMVRNSSVAEAIQPLLDWSGLIVTCVQNPGEDWITIDVRSGSTYEAELTAASGIVSGGGWGLKPPSATRILVGGPGQDAARAFWYGINTVKYEQDYGDIIEVFKDATGANLTWPDSLSEQYKVAKYYLLRSEVSTSAKNAFRSYLNAALRTGLADGVSLSSVTAELTETPEFRLGGEDGIHLGDKIKIRAASGVLFSDQITEGQYSLTNSGGLEVTPILGQITDDPNRAIANSIDKLAAAQRRQTTSR